MDEFAEMLKAEELLEAQSMVTPIFNSPICGNCCSASFSTL